MRATYQLLYRLGFKPWELMARHRVAGQIATLFDCEEEGRDPPYGSALDLGCGSGIWAVSLAVRGWKVTGVEVVSKALDAARKRAREAGVEVQLVPGDITDLRSADLGSGFDLILDFGTVHGLNAREREAVGQGVSAVAAADARLLMFAFAPGRRWPMPRGMNRRDVLAAYPGWSLIDEQPMDVTGAPRPVRKAEPRWYRLRPG